MELRQEINHLSERIHERIDKFSDSSDETLIEEQSNLEKQVSNIKYEISRQDEKCLDEIRALLYDSDAKITEYELESSVFSNEDLIEVKTRLEQGHDLLNNLNPDDLFNQNETFLIKFNDFIDLYIKLVSRLHKLQQTCDDKTQVGTLKFEQDVGLQVDDPSIQTQTEDEAWTKSLIDKVGQELNSIDTHLLSDSENLLLLLETIYYRNQELESNLQNTSDADLQKSMQKLQSQLKEKRNELVHSRQMNYLVDEILNENDEVKITKLLEIIPSKGPFSKRLKEALRIIQQQKNNEEFPLSTDLPTATVITETASSSEDTQHPERSCRGWIYRWVRASLPIQAGLLVLLGVLSFAPIAIWKEEVLCTVQNNFRDSIEPMMTWNNGPPPT